MELATIQKYLDGPQIFSSLEEAAREVRRLRAAFAERDTHLWKAGRDYELSLVVDFVGRISPEAAAALERMEHRR